MLRKSVMIAATLGLSVHSLPTQATLTSYTGAGGAGLVYSSIGNSTWTQDANLFKTMYDANNNLVNLITAVTPSYNDSYFGPQAIGNGGAQDDFDTSTGRLSWWGAKAFVNYLNNINYGGSHQWALPSAGANPQDGYNVNGTAFDKLFYNELGGTAGGIIPNTVTFNNEQADAYWLDTEYAPYPYLAWLFYRVFYEDQTYNGYQGGNHKSDQFYAWAVSPGQVSAVPIPSAVWLMGSSLLGFAGMKRRR